MEPAHRDVQAVFGAKLQARQLRAKADAANLRVSVLEREVQMAGLRRMGVGNFALDENVGELAREQIADTRSEVGHRPDRAARHQRELKLFDHGAAICEIEK